MNASWSGEVSNGRKEALWEQQGAALRNPAEILAGSPSHNGIAPTTLAFGQTESVEAFTELLHNLGITLLLTREYEHLVIGLTTEQTPNGVRLVQSFVHLPHPSGLVADRTNQRLYVAATRNPNQIWEFKPVRDVLRRVDYEVSHVQGAPALMPSRTKFFAGAYYFHDLALIGGGLYANSVGQNAIVKIDMEQDVMDAPVWWPRCIEDNNDSDNAAPNFTANFLQLNSIAAGISLETSFFSASGARMLPVRPGHLEYPVDGTGVLFSGATREVIATGLTRPHSARLHKERVWVDNSGYGELGYIEDGRFHKAFKLPSWTRGLCIMSHDTLGDVAFVGVSRVLPKFAVYAPGLTTEFQSCGIFALDLVSGKELGSIIWDAGNQIFAIDWLEHRITSGFPFADVAIHPEAYSTFYAYQY
jgi:uncharacterized protein (TIGR03032 family)